MPIRCEGKKFILSLILIIFLIGGFFVYANNAQADPEPPPSGAAPNTTITVPGASKSASEPAEWSMRIPVLFHAIGGIFFLILKLLNGLVWLGANLADSILKITSFTTVNVVTIGWGITRGLANMFFALILLVMSISTILQIESFGIKKILPRLIIAALLINFSLMFAGIIIDFAQVLTSYFLTAGAGDTGISANLTNGLKIVQIYNFSKADQGVVGAIAAVMWGPSLQMIVEQFMAIILFIAAAFAFFAMSFFLVARIVWIWLLLIFAPLAWISFIVPGAPGRLGSLWNDWWKKFLSWTLFAPIYAFFLYLALTIAKNGVSLGTGPWGGGASSANTLPLQSEFFKTPETILQYIVIIMILLGGLKAAQDMGVTGAEKIRDWGKKGYRFAGRLTERWAAKGAKEKGTGVWANFRRGTSYLSPQTWRGAWKARQARKEREAYTVATGARLDLLNRVLPGREKTDYKERAEKAEEMEELKEITSVDAQRHIDNYKDATAKKGKEARAIANLFALARQGDINDLFTDLKNPNYTTDAKGFESFVENELMPKFGEQIAHRVGFELSRSLEGVGQYWASGCYKGEYNPKTKKTEYVEQSLPDAEKMSYQRWSRNLHPQQQARTTHRTSYYAEGWDDQAKEVRNFGLDEAGKERISALLERHVNDINPEVTINLMCNFANEIKKLNPEIYKTLRDNFETLEKSNAAAYAKFEGNALKMKTGLTASHWKNVP